MARQQVAILFGQDTFWRAQRQLPAIGGERHAAAAQIIDQRGDAHRWLPDDDRGGISYPPRRALPAAAPGAPPRRPRIAPARGGRRRRKTTTLAASVAIGPVAAGRILLRPTGAAPGML